MNLYNICNIDASNMQTYLNAPINGINKSLVLAVHNLQFFFLNNEVCVLVSEVLVWFFFTSYIIMTCRLTNYSY